MRESVCFIQEGDRAPVSEEPIHGMKYRFENPVAQEEFAWGYVQSGHGAQDLVDFMFQEGFHVLRDVVESYTFFNMNLTDWAEDVDCSGGDLFVQQGCLQDVFGRSHSCTASEQTTPAAEQTTPNSRNENIAGGVAHR